METAKERIITNLLEVYENLEKSIGVTKAHQAEESILEGLNLTYNQLKGILEKEGLSSIDSTGKKLDPFKHEVLMTETRDDCEEDTILEEYQKGYMLNNKVIRYSKVKVSSRKISGKGGNV